MFSGMRYWEIYFCWKMFRCMLFMLSIRTIWIISHFIIIAFFNIHTNLKYLKYGFKICTVNSAVWTNLFVMWTNSSFQCSSVCFYLYWGYSSLWTSKSLPQIAWLPSCNSVMHASRVFTSVRGRDEVSKLQLNHRLANFNLISLSNPHQ